MKKRIGWIILIVVLIIIGWRIGSVVQKRTKFLTEEITEKKVAVKVVSPKIGRIAKSLKFPGTVKGKNQVQVFSDVPGRLLKYTVIEGQHIKRNETICLIDRSLPGMEYEPAKVRSPISGVVLRLLLDQGITVAPSVPVAIVADSRKLVVAINVGEKFLPQIKKGMRVTVMVDQYPERKISARVLRISPFVEPMSRSAYCEVAINNPEGITIGSFANVFIYIEEKTNTLLLPRNAIIEDLMKGEDYCFIVENSKAKKIPIEVGINNEDTIEVLSDLPLETKIVTLGKEYLKEGASVEVVE